jgi:hypothetical protein
MKRTGAVCSSSRAQTMLDRHRRKSKLMAVPTGQVGSRAVCFMVE